MFKDLTNLRSTDFVSEIQRLKVYAGEWSDSVRSWELANIIEMKKISLRSFFHPEKSSNDRSWSRTKVPLVLVYDGNKADVRT